MHFIIELPLDYLVTNKYSRTRNTDARSVGVIQDWTIDLKYVQHSAVCSAAHILFVRICYPLWSLPRNKAVQL